MARGTKKAEEPKKEYKEVECGAFKLRLVWENSDKDSDLVGICNLRVGDLVSISCNLRYNSKSDKYYLAMPSYQKKDKSYANYVIPCSKEVAQDFTTMANELGKLLEEE